ncbi:hypothetical protein DMH04_04930 [Kibdelosporangium aridum]|uniref:Uncharacterized protein n=1 Tax=Kibdelosporangium aridum TaxID=2030 RepID=A0A428ZRV4_KIBAR|nr:hypothetical protein [Kibdelosporangium aridum]RSM90796.1 hypothetical protein DMH04_04930 [Kibdelosporangium aridum]
MLRKRASIKRLLTLTPQQRSTAPLNEETYSTWQRWFALLIIFLILTCTVIAAIDWPLPDPLQTNLRVVVFVAACVLTIYLIHHRDRPNPGQPNPDRLATPPTGLGELIEAQNFVVHHYGEEAVKYFAHTLLDLNSYLARVDEEFVPVHRNLHVKTMLTFRTIQARNVDPLKMKAPPEEAPPPCLPADQRIVIPVVVADGDQLIDNLAVTDASNKALPLLPRWEVLGLITATLRMFFEQQVRRLKKTGDTDDLPDIARGLLAWVLVDAVCAVGNRHVSIRRDGSREKVSAQKAALDGLEHLERIGMTPEAILQIRRLCDTLASEYLTVCEVTPSGGVNTVVKYCHTYPSQVAKGSNYERRRARRGLDQCRFDLTMSRALETDSYHLQFTAPESQYVYSHHLERPGGRIIPGHDLTVAGVPRFARHYHDEGRSVAHAHIRKQGIRPGTHNEERGDIQPLTSVVRVREVPPGTLASTVLLSLVTTAVIVFVTVARIGLDGQSGGANLPALLLALPAFLAGAMGKSVDSARLARTPMLTYYGLSATGILSFSAALLYVLDAACNLRTELTITLLWNVAHWTVDWTWLTLSFFSVLLFLFLWREKRDQTWNYLKRLQNSVDRSRE